jgi:hypothetical protein
MSVYAPAKFAAHAALLLSGAALSGIGDSTSSASSGATYDVTHIGTGGEASSATDSGTANAYVITTTASAGSLATGQLVQFTPSHINTGASIVTYNGRSATAIVNQFGNALTGGELSIPTWLQFTGSAWQIAGTGPTPDKARTVGEIAARVIPFNYTIPPGYVIRYEVNTTPGTTDMTAGFQNAVNSGAEVEIPDGTYKIGSTVSLRANTVLLGMNRAMVIINGPSSAPTFQYLSPLTGAVQNTGMRFENFTLNAFKGIQLNQQGNTAHYGSLASFPADVFNTEGYLVGPVFRHVTFNGTYTASSDPHADTNSWPTTNTKTLPAQYANPTDLIGYGYAILAVKTFDMDVEQSNLFTNFGVAVLLDGSDINNIGGRFQGNARHLHILAHDSYGDSNKFSGRDVLANRRRGAIYIDSASSTIIDGNFFEGALGLNRSNSSAAGTFIASLADVNTHISNNRFEANRVGAPAGSPELDLSPTYGMIISANSADYTPGLPGAQIQVRTTYYYNPANAVGRAGSNSFFMRFSGNSDSLPPPEWLSAAGMSYPVVPQVSLDSNDSRLFSAQNPKTLSNSGAATFPWKISSLTGRAVINTVNTPLNVQFYSTPDDLDLLVRFRANYVSGAGSVTISWGGVTVYNSTLGFTPGGLNEQDITIRRPDAEQGIKPIVVTLSDATVEYESMQIIPVGYQIMSAPPTNPAFSWRRGDEIKNSAVTATGIPEWFCTTPGPGGTAVFTAAPAL